MGKKKGKRSTHQGEVKLYKGKFEITRSGMGFVIVEGLKKDIIIRPNDFNKAFHGDFVRVEITNGDVKTGRIQGKIIQIIERKQKQFVGLIEVNRDYAFFIPESEKALPNFYVSLSNLNNAKDGEPLIPLLVIFIAASGDTFGTAPRTACSMWNFVRAHRRMT
jgi:ribonuclease R